VTTWGAEVRPEIGDEGGELKVFRENQNQPALKITRSLGDEQSKRIGITYEPEICEYKIAAEDRAIIIGTDGFWGKVTNEESAEILNYIYQK
jgi:serine/threonine protein phosphatase PrpC